MIQKLVEFITKTLVDNPDQVSVSQKDVDGKLVIEIRVAEHDVKRVIGKEGRVIRSLRSLVNNVDPVMDKEIAIDIIQ